ncbi:MAG TPA: carboxypeptidase regulatory-like domain-containing protein [Terriglobales bacterium]|nr:carboxypeptidase regulatory-like domain-containing protein [Terriglobales bacterium]
MVRAGICFLVLFAVTIFSTAQTPDSATIRGQARDQSAAALPGVEVTVSNTLVERKSRTNAAGAFSFFGLPAGTYTLTAHKSGFADVTRTLTLAGGTSANIDLQLGLSEIQTAVTVTGTVGAIRTDEPQLGDHLGLKEMQDTPLLNHRITYLPLLNAANRPAINQGDAFMNQNLFTTNGSGRRQTSFVVDGSSADDSWGRQTIFTNLPLLAVEEMTVLENAFSAEYGATTGGVVNIVTRSGGDNLHGDFFGTWRPNGTAAKLSGFTSTSATSGNQVLSDSLGQLSASLSGPIPGTDDHTHFFFAGEYSRENRGSPITSPIAPGVFVGHYADWMTFVRLDHQLNQNNNLFFRANTDSFHDTNPNGAVGGNNLSSVDRIFRRRTYSVELGDTSVLSPTLLNNARAQFLLASPITEFDPLLLGTQFVVPVSTGGTFTSGTSQSALLLNRQYGFSDTLAASWSKHQVNFGADVLHAHNGGDSKEFGGPIFLGQLTYNTCTQPLSVCESPAYLDDIANVARYTQSYGNGNYTVGDTLWSLFAQDNARVTPSLTVNLGLRYEQQTFTDARKNFAPRIGFAYDWLGHGKTVVRGGYGIYYAQVVDNSEANYALSGPTGVFNFVAGPGQIGFPSSVAAVPLPAFPTGAVAPVRSLYIRPGRAAFYNQFFPVSDLIGYPGALLNPYSQQATLGLQHEFGKGWLLGADYVWSHTIHVVRALDVDPPSSFVRTAQGQTRTAQAANCTRPLWVAFYASAGQTCNPLKATTPQPAYSVIQTDVNDGFVQYNALDVNLSHRFTNFTMLASYVYSHAIDNVDPDTPGGNPNDPNFPNNQEQGNAIFDQQHRFVLSGAYAAPWGVNVGGVATLASGLPFNFVTGTANSGDNGATTDRPVINGIVVPRNAGRGNAIYEVSPFVEKDFPIGEKWHVRGRVEAFNVFNHPNFVGYSGTFGNGAAPGPGFGQPLTGVTNQLPARSLQFSLRLTY